MVSVKRSLQFSFLFERRDGSYYGAALDASRNEHIAYIICPDGTVYERSDTFPLRGWKYLPITEAERVRNSAAAVLGHIPAYRG